MLSNAIRGHLAELGIIAAKGRNGTGELLKIIADEPAAQQYRGVLFLSFKHGRYWAVKRREFIRTAKAISIELPTSILLRADEVIE